MGLRMRRSIKIAPGVRLNIGTRGVGVSVGTRGLRYSINSSGRATTTVGLPGTGLSYSTSSNVSGYSSARRRKSELEKAMERANKENQKQLELEYARAMVDEYEKKIEAIISIHKDCQRPINWREIFNRPEPFPKGTVGNKERLAQQELNNYQPGIINKTFKFMNDSQKEKLIQNLELAKKEDADEYQEWQDLHAIAEKVLSKDMDLMLEVVGELNPFEDLVDLGSGFEIGFINEKTVEVEFDIMSNDVVPLESKSLTSTGKLSTKALPKSKRLDIIQDYVCSCSIKIARELFAILPLNMVIVHAKDAFVNTQVGNQEVKDILSVKFDRPTFYRLNFDLIDPSDSMANFEHNMKFLKTQGFQPIDRIN